MSGARAALLLAVTQGRPGAARDVEALGGLCRTLGFQTTLRIDPTVQVRGSPEHVVEALKGCPRTGRTVGNLPFTGSAFLSLICSHYCPSAVMACMITWVSFLGQSFPCKGLPLALVFSSGHVTSFWSFPDRPRAPALEEWADLHIATTLLGLLPGLSLACGVPVSGAEEAFLALGLALTLTSPSL